MKLWKFFFASLCSIFLTSIFGEEIRVKLSSEYEMPIIGMGTWMIKAEDIDASITSSLENGYRHFDTALNYENQEAIGKSFKKWLDKGGKREDLFITNKLPPFGHKNVEKYLKLSLARLGLQYVDMYLIQTPFSLISDESGYDMARNNDGSVVFDLQSDIVSTWKQMEAQVKAGLTRSIGLANFNESQVTRIYNNSEIKPSNLQVEVQVFNQQKSLQQLCAKHGIALTGSNTLGSPFAEDIFKSNGSKYLPNLLEHPLILTFAVRHKKTSAQILLRYSVQKGIIVIPEGLSPTVVKDNMDIFDFELSKDEMQQLSELDMGKDGRIFDFRFFKGIDKHPEYPFQS